MTDQQLAEWEAAAEAERRAEQKARMAQAMKAVAEAATFDTSKVAAYRLTGKR